MGFSVLNICVCKIFEMEGFFFFLKANCFKKTLVTLNKVSLLLSVCSGVSLTLCRSLLPSQHLKILREAGLVYGVKRGYYTHYSVDKDALGAVIDELETMRTMHRKPCDGPFYGCPESEYVRCQSYVPPEKRE